MALPCFLALFLALAVSAEAGPLTGRVLDPAGRPVPAVTVLVDGPLGVRTTTTDAEGRFSFNDLADASYRVLVEAPGLRDQLAPHGVVVRDCTSFGLPRHVRIGLPDDDGLQRLDAALSVRGPDR